MFLDSTVNDCGDKSIYREDFQPQHETGHSDQLERLSDIVSQ